MWQSMIFIDFWLCSAIWQFLISSLFFLAALRFTTAFNSFACQMFPRIFSRLCHLHPSIVEWAAMREMGAFRIFNFIMWHTKKQRRRRRFPSSKWATSVRDCHCAMNKPATEKKGHEEEEKNRAKKAPTTNDNRSIIIYIFIMFIHSNWIIVDVAFSRLIRTPSSCVSQPHNKRSCVCGVWLRRPQKLRSRWRYKVKWDEELISLNFTSLFAAHSTKELEGDENKSKRREKQELLMNQSIIEVEENRHEMETF